MRFVKSKNIMPGDLVRVKRSKGYYHYGIMSDVDKIIHFTGPIDDSITKIENIKIRETSVENFVRGDTLQVLRPFSSSFDVNTVIERAKGFIGESKIFGKSYNLISNNCEHFARYIYFGKSDSKQVSIVTNVLATTAIATGAVTTAAAIIIGTRRKKK